MIEKGWIEKGWIEKGWIEKGWIDSGWRIGWKRKKLRRGVKNLSRLLRETK